MAIYDSVCERYGITLRTLLDNYSMAQLALISHVASCKVEDMERENNRPDRREITARKGKLLNPDDKNNAAAFAMIAGGFGG